MSGKQDQALKIVERERQAVQLRLAGVAYTVIAAKLGYSNRSGAYKAVTRALKATLQEPSDELRILVGGRLDELLLATWPSARSGNLGAVDRALRIIERQCRLYGLDAPTQTDLGIHSTGGPVEFTLKLGDDERATRIQEILDRAEARRLAGGPSLTNGTHSTNGYHQEDYRP